MNHNEKTASLLIDRYAAHKIWRYLQDTQNLTVMNYLKEQALDWENIYFQVENEFHLMSLENNPTTCSYCGSWDCEPRCNDF